ncbi:MAG: hypothetical protein E6J41_22590 [Chloroflexi bacterium]|nr:MAG: hypothetical protein E6J41_22590 [Chloroflexota bacterium]
MTRWDVRLALAAAGAVLALVAVDALAGLTPLAADLTRSGQFTLTPRSVQVLGQLDAEVTVTGFFRPDQLAARRDAAALLDLYRQRSSRVQVRFADPDQDAALAQRLGAAAGSLALQYRDRTPVVLDAGRESESDVTAAIERLRSGRTPVVCWASGDGERDPQDADPETGYSAAAALLRASSYATQQVALAQPRIPAACDVLVVLGPARALTDVEGQAVSAYLAGGGRLLVAADPWIDGTILASVNGLLQPYGVGFGGGLVIEPDPAHAAAGDSTVPVVALAGGDVFLPAATPITGAPDSGASAALASSSAGAFAIAQQRTDLGRRVGDDSGPFVLVRSVEQPRSAGVTRIVVAGTSGLAENRTLPPAASSANPSLLLASLDWLSGQDELLAIPPRPLAAAPLSLSTSGLRWNVLLALPLPLLAVLAAGIPAFLRRRDH